VADLTRITGIFLVDERGWVLLQERDEHAPIAPNQWGIVGGHVDPGEGWEESRDRELLEETGLTLPDGTLEQWYDGVVEHEALGLHHEWRLWVGRVALTDEDIVCGEGRQIVFVDPAEARTLDLSESLAYFLPRLLRSDAYERALRSQCW
jgi:8-oxo-dGTP diphosphatase